MDINEVCNIFKIGILNDNYYCLNDIAKISKQRLSNLIGDTDTIKQGNKYYVSLKEFIKILFYSKSDDCVNIINMIDIRKNNIHMTNDVKHIEILKIQYDIEKEKTKQLYAKKEIKILNAKLEFAKLGLCLEIENTECPDSDDDINNEPCETYQKSEYYDYDEIDLVD